MNRMMKIAMLAAMANGINGADPYRMPVFLQAPPRTNRPSGAARIKRQAKRLHNIRKRLPK